MPENPLPGRWRALAVCMAAGVMIFIDVSIVNVALPSFQTGLGAAPSELSWIVAGYTLAFGIALVPGGRLGDSRGRKKMFIVGLVLFALASVAAGLAMTPLWLVVARLAQGIAGGLLNPQLLGLIQQMFSGSERGTAFGVFGAVNASSTAIGPLVGGLLIEAGGPEFGWRLVFLVNLPFALLALVLAPRLLPADPPREERSTQVSLDPVGAGLLALSVVAVLLPLVLADRDPAGAPWWTIAIGAVFLAVFVWWERRYAARGGDPLANGRVLRSPGYVLGSSLGTIYMAGSTAIFFVLTVYFQQGLGYSALEAGAASLPYAVGSAIAAAIGGRIVGRFGRPLVVAGTVVMAVGIVSTLLIVRGETGPMVGLLTAGPLFLSGIGSGLVITPNQALTLQEVPTDEGGTAAGMQQTAQRIGSSIGIALVASVFFTVLASSGRDYGAALSTGMLVITAFVVAAFALGVGDLLRGRRRSTPSSSKTNTKDDQLDDEQPGADDRHCDRAHASSGRTHAGHTYH
ncbi:MFS transporter [Actinomycetospora termitidis]|uniref:MFS transporter n=1 Tax=Actinomycetospora termitidis TaxID=3053470 RepID=A0ABT7MIQ2_9PSEU|nr:MFS transporter [Actinomycetospora sp. Odt1-22]MDL5160530.1 MFS transporter [Actinomycetospora sp. Odt1-22]